MSQERNIIKAQTDWKQYLIQQAALHPFMEPQDVYKLIFQAAFGAEHLLQDKEAAYAYFQKEFEEVEEMDSPMEEALYEQIQASLYRVNLRAWKKRGLSAEWLFRMFAGSVEDRIGEDGAGNPGRVPLAFGKQQFEQYVEVAKAAAAEGVFTFSQETFAEYTKEYGKTGPGAVHHSECYRTAEKPSYRLVNGKYVRLIPVLELLANLLSKAQEFDTGLAGKPIVLAIDGRCGSGKSTMAGMLSEILRASAVPMDDFFLPPELRTAERLAEPGGNVHYERFCQEVLHRLKIRETFSYRRFDCSRMELGEYRKVPDAVIRIVEGAYSCHPIFGEYADLKVFSDIEPEEQLERIRSRNGEQYLAVFKERWIPMEEKYFAAFHIREGANIIL